MIIYKNELLTSLQLASDCFLNDAINNDVKKTLQMGARSFVKNIVEPPRPACLCCYFKKTIII